MRLLLQKRKTIRSVIQLLLIGFFMVSANIVHSQGWEFYFGGNAEDFGQSILQTSNNGLMVAGFSESFGDDNDFDVYVVRTDVDGTEVWSKTYDDGFIEHGYHIIENAEGDFLIAGDIKSTQISDIDAYLLKIDAAGNKIWSKTYGEDGLEQGFRVSSLTDGGYLIVGRTDDATITNGGEDVLLIRVDADGNEIWTKNYGGLENDAGRSVMELTDGYLLLGRMGKDGNDPSDILMIKTDFDGNVLWQHTYGTDQIDEGYDVLQSMDGNFVGIGYAGGSSEIYLFKTDTDGNEIWTKTFGGAFGDEAYDLIETAKGDLVATGVTELSASSINIFLLSVDTDGNLNWLNNDIGRSSHTDFGYGVVETHDGGFAIAGYNALGLANFNDVSIIKTNANGDFYSNHIQGKIVIDEIDNCNFDNGEPGLTDWLLRAESDDLTFFGSTDADGNFDILVDTGVYTLSVLLKNDYWEPCTGSFDDLIFDEFYAYDTIIRYFPMKKMVDCSLLEVDISAPVVQNCSNIAYDICYCNDGTSIEENGVIQIVLDESLTYSSATILLTNQIDSLLIFEIDPIDINQCENFSLIVSSDCDGLPFESYIVGAEIFPDTFCIVDGNWNGASIDVNGYCDSDSIRFEIKNEGDGDMDMPQNYIVIEDILIEREEPYVLISGDNQTVTVPNNGGTYRIIAEQAPNHPGNKYPTIAIEGCDNGVDEPNTGFVTIFQENENEATASIDAQETLELPITNIEIRGYPKGYPKNGKQLISANTDLEYHLLFHNDGTDTIKRVVIRDTLSQNLDISTIRPGASSHLYDFQLYDTGILKFTFDDIDLIPDALGYVKFKIAQQPNLPTDTEIKNSAAMYVGYAAKLDTDTTVHHIGGEMIQDFVITDVEKIFVPELEVNAYPNPFRDAAVIEIKGKNYQTLTLSVFDVAGRKVREEKSSGNQIELPRKNLNSGMYIFQLHADGIWIASGKITIQ